MNTMKNILDLYVWDLKVLWDGKIFIEKIIENQLVWMLIKEEKLGWLWIMIIITKRKKRLELWWPWDASEILLWELRGNNCQSLLRLNWQPTPLTQLYLRPGIEKVRWNGNNPAGNEMIFLQLNNDIFKKLQ